MTDQPMDPRDDRLDDVDVPRDTDHDNDEPVVNLDQAQDEVDGEHETADDKYIQVIDGRPETLGYEGEGDAPEVDADMDDVHGRDRRDPDAVGFKDDMYTTEPGTEGTSRA